MPEGTEATEGKGTLSLVPQIFYDIIARLIPGITLIILSYLVFCADNITVDKVKIALYWFSDEKSPKTFIFLSMLLFSYILSVALGQLAHLIEYNVKCYKDYLKKEDKKTTEDVIMHFNAISSLKLPDDMFPELPLMYDYIRLKEPGAGARIVKLRAEYHMCLYLSLGLLIIVMTDLLFNNTKLFSKALNLEILVLLAMGIFFKEFVHRRNRYIWGCCNHWLLLRYGNHIQDHGDGSGTV